MDRKCKKSKAGVFLVLALAFLLPILGCRLQEQPRKKGKTNGVGKPKSLEEAKVVFVSLRDGNEEIYVMNSKGGDQTRLTRNSAPDIDPQASPNGKSIAWRTKDARGSWRLYAVREENRKPQPLATKTSGDVLKFSWSPHSNWLALVKAVDVSVDRQVLLIDSMGVVETNLLEEDPRSLEDDPTWFSDNDRLVYVTQGVDNVPKIFWRFVPRSSDSLFLSPGTKPSVSPDKKWVAFVNIQGEISVVPVQGGAARVLAQTGMASDVVSAPQWSPDNKLVLFGALFGSPSRGDIYVATVDGRTLKKLATGFNPRWTPDGKLIFFEDLEPGTGLRQVWSMEPNGTSRRQLTKGNLGENHSPFPFTTAN